MINKYDELTKLKELFDAGILSQEEFDETKKKLLEDDSQSSNLSTKTNSSSYKKWWYIGGISFIFCGIVALCLNNCGNKTEYAYYDSSAFDSTAVTDYEQELDLSEGIEEGSEEDYEINNPWKKDYFHNDFGEDMLDYPYIRTYVSGSWNLEIAYNNEMGFRFSLHDHDGELKHMYSPISIVFRTTNKEKYLVEPDAVENYCAYVYDSDNVSGIATLLEEGKFDILMEYEMYNEQHRMVWNVDMSSGMFSKSVEKML